MSLRDVSLHDKYDLGKDRVLLNGTQALVRLMLMQRARDVAARSPIASASGECC